MRATMIDAPALLRVTTTRPCGCVPPNPTVRNYRTERAIIAMDTVTHVVDDVELFDGFRNISVEAYRVRKKSVTPVRVAFPTRCRIEAWRTGVSLMWGGDKFAFHMLPRVAHGTETFEPMSGHACPDAHQPIYRSHHFFGTFEATTGVTPYRDEWGRPPAEEGRP